MELVWLPQVSINASGRKRLRALNLQLSSPSNIPGTPTKSMGIPSSASASILRGCCLAKRDEKFAEVKYVKPSVGMFKSFGGPGGGGRTFS